MRMIYDGLQVQFEPIMTQYAGEYGYYIGPIQNHELIYQCFYCGSILKESTERCPNCGAGDWRKKRRSQ